jgi:hypothetical protein
MKKVSKRAPECKVGRQVRLVEPAHPFWAYVVLEITVGRDVAFYSVSRQRSDWGQAFRFVKQGQVEPLEDGSGWHDCVLDGEDSICSCKGFTRWGHCKHLWASEVIVRRGWL